MPIDAQYGSFRTTTSVLSFQRPTYVEELNWSRGRPISSLLHPSGNVASVHTRSGHGATGQAPASGGVTGGCSGIGRGGVGSLPTNVYQPCTVNAPSPVI